MNEDFLLPAIESSIAAVAGRLPPACRRAAMQCVAAQAAADTGEMASFVALVAVDCQLTLASSEHADVTPGIPSAGLTHVASFLTRSGLREPEAQVAVIMDMQDAGADILGQGRHPMRLFAAVEDIERALALRALSWGDRRRCQ